MARVRFLKPGFFTNDVLAEIEPLGRLLFEGLWCIADRAGRLADRPKKIKAEILPYDDCDVDGLLHELAARNFIERYEVNGERYIQVVNFGRHQTPHIKEQESLIPAPPSFNMHPVQASSQSDTSIRPASGQHQTRPSAAPPVTDPDPVRFTGPQPDPDARPSTEIATTTSAREAPPVDAWGREVAALGIEQPGDPQPIRILRAQALSSGPRLDPNSQVYLRLKAYDAKRGPPGTNGAHPVGKHQAQASEGP